MLAALTAPRVCLVQRMAHYLGFFAHRRGFQLRSWHLRWIAAARLRSTLAEVRPTSRLRNGLMIDPLEDLATNRAVTSKPRRGGIRRAALGQPWTRRGQSPWNQPVDVAAPAGAPFTPMTIRP